MKFEMQNKDGYTIKKIVKRFKSKNGVPLFAYIGIWEGRDRSEEIKYIEREDTREYINSFIEKGDKKKMMGDELLEVKIKELQNTFILEYFTTYDRKDYKFDAYDKKFNFKKIVEELKILIENKEQISFNEEWGVGKVHYRKDKYVIELYYYGNLSFPLKTTDLKKIAKWLWEFSKNEGERIDNSRAMAIAFRKDMMSAEEREELKKDYEKKVREALK